MPDTVTYEVLKAGIVSSVISGGECCTRFYLNIDVDVQCTVTVKQFDFIILLLMLFNRIHSVMSLKQ